MAMREAQQEVDDGEDDGDAYEDDSQDSGECLDGESDDQERQHFLDVCWSLLDYPRDANYDVNRLSETLRDVDPLDAEIWLGSGHGAVNRDAWVQEVIVRVEANTRFLKLLPCPMVCALDLGPDGDSLVSTMPESHRVASRNSSKVRSTLRQFVRDWAVEGKEERKASYWPLINGLMRHMPPPPRGPDGRQTERSITVLCPGSGLGRLPFDLVRMGYAAQGNEFSYHMLLGSFLVLNRCPAANCHTIFPFVLGTTNRRARCDHLAAVSIPDVCPSQVLRQDAELSMAAGEFVQVYHEQKASWDAVLTCFFLDTAKNVFIYIRTIADIIRPGGFWINLGPLLYHYAEMPNEVSIELSWDELRPAICRYFDILEETRHTAQYTTNPTSMMGVRYNCIFFVAKRNQVQATGESNPVF